MAAETEPTLRVIGAIQEVLTRAPPIPPPSSAASPTRLSVLVTATVTEKSYALTPAVTSDTGHPEIAPAISADPHRPQSFVGLAHRGPAPPPRRGSCAPSPSAAATNLSGNGARLARAVGQFAEARGEPDLARWITSEVRFPDSMVDSITPATDDALRADAARRLGVTDATGRRPAGSGSSSVA